MKLLKRVKNILYYLFLVFSLFEVIRIMLKCANDFGDSVHYLITMALGLLIGFSCLVLRKFKLLKNGSSYFYRYIGSVNIATGLSLLYVLLFGENMVSAGNILVVLINLFLGISIFIDVYLFNRNKNRGSQ